MTPEKRWGVGVGEGDIYVFVEKQILVFFNVTTHKITSVYLSK